MRKFWSFWLSELFFLLFSFTGIAQSDFENYQYLFPVNPGQINQLYGTMGELRRSHFHGGLDIRTNNESGWPIRAAQDGYISRATVSSFGYGNALYITHPDGNLTLYGHLDRMNGMIFDYILKRQNECQSYELDEYFSANRFQINRGDTIGFSGNTGSSNGPHLHFEVRKDGYFLNPLEFCFNEIKDKIEPNLIKIALRTLDINSRVNGEYGRYEFPLIRKSKGEYGLGTPIYAFGKIGLELFAYDKIDYSPGKCGVNSIEVKVDDKTIFFQIIDKISVDSSHYIEPAINNSTYPKSGNLFYKLYVDTGNHFDFYNTINSGIINFNSNDIDVKIYAKDAMSNESVANLNLKCDEKFNPTNSLPLKKEGLSSEGYKNVLKVISRFCPNSDQLKVYCKGIESSINSDYRNAYANVYLINLLNIIPDSVKNCNSVLDFHIKTMVPSNAVFKYYGDLVDITFSKNSLYDTIFLQVEHEYENKNEIFKIGNPTVPIKNSIYISMKVDSGKVNKSKNIYRKNGQSLTFLNGKWENGRIRFFTSKFGEFVCLADTVPPTISRIALNRKVASFKISDSLSGIEWYEATVNGKWLLMSYDYKSGIIKTLNNNLQEPIIGDFKIKVVDRQGNEKTYTQKIF